MATPTPLAELNRVIRQFITKPNPVKYILQIDLGADGADDFIKKLDGKHPITVTRWKTPGRRAREHDILPEFHRIGNTGYFYTHNGYLPEVLHFALGQISGGVPFLLSQPAFYIDI